MCLKKLMEKWLRFQDFWSHYLTNYNVLNEFLLVPDPQSCIHVPPPPPNLIVHVHLKEPIPSEEAFNPAWIIGRLKIETTESEYGSASYKMQADKLEKFNYEGVRPISKWQIRNSLLRSGSTLNLTKVKPCIFKFPWLLFRVKFA